MELYGVPFEQETLAAKYDDVLLRTYDGYTVYYDDSETYPDYIFIDIPNREKPYVGFRNMVTIDPYYDLTRSELLDWEGNRIMDDYYLPDAIVEEYRQYYWSGRNDILDEERIQLPYAVFLQERWMAIEEGGCPYVQKMEMMMEMAFPTVTNGMMN